MLQRRKRYKNRAILVGFKTLAVGSVDMSQVKTTTQIYDVFVSLYGNLSSLGPANPLAMLKASQADALTTFK